MLRIRKEHPSFGLGEFIPVANDNPSILAFLRKYQNETLLCVFNLAATPRGTLLTLDDCPNHGLLDVFGQSELATSDERGRVQLTLGSRSFYWLRLIPKETHGSPENTGKVGDIND